MSAGLLTQLRCWIGRKLLKPHWVACIEHYQSQAVNPELSPLQREHCAYIAIGLKRGICPPWLEPED